MDVGNICDWLIKSVIIRNKNRDEELAKAKRKLWKKQIRDTLESLSRGHEEWIRELMYEGFFVSTNEFLHTTYHGGLRSTSSFRIDDTLYEKDYHFKIEGGHRILHGEYKVTWFCNSPAGQLRRVYNDGKLVSVENHGCVWDNVDPSQPLYKGAKFCQVILDTST